MVSNTRISEDIDGGRLGAARQEADGRKLASLPGWTVVVECREALAVPGEPGRAVVLRRIMACSGDARLRVLLDRRRRARWACAGHKLSLAAGEHHDLVLELSEQPLPNAPPASSGLGGPRPC